MRLFIADADQEVRVSLQMRLHQEAGMPVVGIAVRSEGLVTQVAASEPDVVLLDWSLPGQPATELLAGLKSVEPRPAIVVLSVRPEVESEAVAAGADAFLSKTVPPDRLMALLRSWRSRFADRTSPADEGKCA
jgi:DNA-binding NarL/FixJ family response regulator